MSGQQIDAMSTYSAAFSANLGARRWGRLKQASEAYANELVRLMHEYNPSFALPKRIEDDDPGLRLLEQQSPWHYEPYPLHVLFVGVLLAYCGHMILALVASGLLAAGCYRSMWKSRYYQAKEHYIEGCKRLCQDGKHANTEVQQVWREKEAKLLGPSMAWWNIWAYQPLSVGQREAGGAIWKLRAE